MQKEIGGYIELELPIQPNLDSNSILKYTKAINSGRNGIRYIIRAYGIKKLYVPYYTCPVVWQACELEGCELVFYTINEKLLPALEFEKDAYILYTNYFGICSKNIEELSKKYKNLLIDNAQAFYMKPMGIGSAYSPRKFFGVSDGGYVYCQKELNEDFEKDVSYDRFSHLLKRIDCGSNFGYEDFWKNDNSLIGQDIKLMSNLTKRLLASIDYEVVKTRRIHNFEILQKSLGKYNKFDVNLTEDDVPMYYPFLIEDDELRATCVKNNIFIPSCWRGMEEKCSETYELYLQKYLHPLIIDQRYDDSDMDRIIKCVKASIKE